MTPPEFEIKNIASIMTLTGRSAGIARILTSGRNPQSHVGMGILITPRLVLTCAHVINSALNRNKMECAPPIFNAYQVEIDWPLVPSASPLKAKIIKWSKPEEVADLSSPEADPGDMALLELEKDAPSVAGIAILADFSNLSIIDDRLSIYGCPRQDPPGRYISAHFKGEVGGVWSQVITDHGVVEAGFSGGAIWNEDQDAVIGMIVEAEVQGGVPAAFSIPIHALQAFTCKLQIEHRRVFKNFYITWRTLALILMTLLVINFGVIQGLEKLEPLMLWAEGRQLPKLWGMIFFAIFAPFLYFLLFLHARSYRFHAWWQRVPAFYGQRPSDSVHNTKVTASVTLFVLVLLPIYMNGHFILQFHDDEGIVSIYPKDFGYTSDELLAGEQTCNGALCTHNDADLYSWATSRYGNFPFNNAYQYGDNGLKYHQTYFPIIEPVVLYILALIALYYAAIGLWTIFTPRQFCPATNENTEC